MAFTLNPKRWWRYYTPQERAPFFMRIILGGYWLLNGSFRFIESMGELSDAFYFLPAPPAWLWAIVATVGEISCGVALLIGFMVTRACWIAILGFAVLFAFMPPTLMEVMHGPEYHMNIAFQLAFLFSLLQTGPGALSYERRKARATGA